MQVDRHYTDPRLVSVYDIENAGRHDIDFYLALAARLSAGVVVDIGCGTGVLAADLAAAGRTVIGVDPASAMLEVARHRPGGDLVTWIEGDSSRLRDSIADLVVMTGHVAQVFVDDSSWRAVLADASRALRPGGTVAFEIRNPSAAAWTRWTREKSLGTYTSPGGEVFQTWVEVTSVEGDNVTFEGHIVFHPGGTTEEHHVAASTLRFRSQPEITASLEASGFRIVDVLGDWAGHPVTPASTELIFIAQVSPD